MSRFQRSLSKNRTLVALTTTSFPQRRSFGNVATQGKGDALVRTGAVVQETLPK